MRVETAFYASLQGIKSNGTAISVIGDNLANSNTVAYKASRVEFGDIYAEGAEGRQSTATPSAGNGSQVKDIRATQELGLLERTGRQLDFGIGGNGFFILTDGTDLASEFYTRAGNFTMAEDGTLVDSDGFAVMGFADAASTELTTLNLLDVTTDISATTAIAVGGNLDSRTAITTPPAAPQTFSEILTTASFTLTTSPVDSLGETHDILVSFYKTAANAWTVQAHIDGADVGGTAGVPSQLGADLPLAFTGTGQLDTANTPVTTITATPAYVNGADPGSITYDFSTVTQVGAISTVNSVTNDGQGAGSIVGYETSKDGTLSAILSSGERAALGVLALKNFAHVERLLRSGNNTFQAGAGVGIETTDRPGSSGLGLLEQNTLERANVDIAEQFTSLLLYQRAYQGNSQMLNTVKDILQRTIDLMR